MRDRRGDGKWGGWRWGVGQATAKSSSPSANHYFENIGYDFSHDFVVSPKFAPTSV